MPSYSNPTRNVSSGVHTVNGVSYPVNATIGGFSKSWTNTPGFRAKKKSGISLTTQQFSSSWIKHSHVEGSFTFGPTSTFPTGANTVSGVMWDSPVGQYCNWPVGHFGFGLYNPDVVAQNNLAMLKRIKDEKVNLAQAFAERKQTANLLVSNVKKIAVSVSNLRKGNITGALNALGVSPTKSFMRAKFGRFQNRTNRIRNQNYNSQALANNWLEIQYGWKPLLGDVYGSAQLLAKSLDRPRIGKVTYSNQIVTNRVETVYYGFSDCLVVVRDLRTISKCKQTIYYNVTSASSRILSEVGISNPYNLAWELVPFSFVVDWFLPVGDYLSAIDATAGCSFVKGTRSTSWQVDNHFSGDGRQHTGTNGNYTYSGHGSGKYEQKVNTRDPLSSFPSNATPRLENPFSMTHVANALALLKAVFSRK